LTLLLLFTFLYTAYSTPLDRKLYSRTTTTRITHQPSAADTSAYSAGNDSGVKI